MRTLLASSAVLLTILLSFTLGIAFGYVVIVAILRAFAQKRQSAEPAGSTTAVAISASSN